jgi:hypothetical protein
MAILNYTTKIDSWKTVGEIQKILSQNNVTHSSIKNEGIFPVALSFTINYKGSPLNFLLPCNHEGVLRCFKKDRRVPNSSKNSDQALRTAWRIVKDWVEAQMAIIQSEQASIEQVFLPYLIVNPNGETLANKMLNNDGLKLLNN